MGTPRIMLRFRDETNPVISAHNAVFDAEGRAFWGLWLKSFEDKAAIADKLKGVEGQSIYIANTASKAKPSIYICDVKRVVLKPRAVKRSLVPKYYRAKIDEVPIWFELASKINEIDADLSLGELLGVPTIYFLTYDANGKIIYDAPQREYRFDTGTDASFVLHLSDIHLGEDHAFRYPIQGEKVDTSSARTLSEVLVEDLTQSGALGRIGCVVISGDIVTKGRWSEKMEISGQSFSGLDLARLFLDDLSKRIGVPGNLFFMVPGNHDIVRELRGNPEAVQDVLLHYDHEKGFRTLREEFCQIYKLSPLNETDCAESGGA